MFNSTRDLLPSSDYLDYANRWRSPHAEPPSHSDRKSCSTRREISSPAKGLGITFRTGIGIAYVTTIRNRHSEMVEKALVSRNSVPEPKFTPGASDSLDYANRWRSPHAEPPSHSDRKSSDSLDYANRWWSPHAEPPSHSDRKSCSTRYEISSPGRGYGSDYLDYANPWRSPHAEPPSHSDRKSCSTRRQISSLGRGYGCPNIADIVTPSGVGTAREAPIQNRHFDPVGKWLHSEISGPAPKFLSGNAVSGCRCDRIRTPLRSNRYNVSLSYRNRL
ncbi:hypothetical protein Taro_054278 [Colocasia esculenta]|uniref:Uncharacterized protein n=1 Tax=Colocasia esculenta TaxID=4460 RepID=A0A843XQ02_COLES|nr:hypothetical protein [Colocasia esculenta]